MVQVLHHAKVREITITPLPIPVRWSDMSDNWDTYFPSEGMKSKVDRKCHVSFVSLGRRRLARLFKCCLLYFVSGPESESESEPESESIRSPESESESEQPHHDSASLIYTPLPGTLFLKKSRKHYSDTCWYWNQCHVALTLIGHTSPSTSSFSLHHQMSHFICEHQHQS